MKKIALAFDLTIIALLFGSSFSVKDIYKIGYWSELSAVLIIGGAIILLLTGIFKRIKN